MDNEHHSDNKKKGTTRLVRGLLPRSLVNPSSALGETNSRAQVSSDNAQQSHERLGLSKLFRRKKHTGSSSQHDLTSAEFAQRTSQDKLDLEGSSIASTTPSQRSTFDLQPAPENDGEVSPNRPIDQASVRNEAQDLRGVLARPSSPVPVILIDDSAAQSSLDPWTVTSGIAYAAPPGFNFFPLVSRDLLTNEDKIPAQAGLIAAIATNSAIKDNLIIPQGFFEKLITKIPDGVDTNSLQTAFHIAKVVFEIKKIMTGDMDTLERRILSIAERLEFMDTTADRWGPKIKEQKVHFERLNIVLLKEIEKLVQLKKEHVRRIADCEDKKLQIAGIFERMNEARIQFALAINFRFLNATQAIGVNQEGILLSKLHLSKVTDYEYHLGSGKEALRRAVCTPGTRERLLNEIITWAKDSSSQTIYWLFGPAGTGKTTIAYTIARRFEMATAEDVICLGGNFFSSRQFQETKSASRIVPTLVYHLALRCKAFADALIDSGNFDIVNQNLRAQLDGLLVGPWLKSEPARLADSSPQYLIVIDALDEIEGTGGSDFLCDLCSTINDNHLSGLKFFATSLPDPRLDAYLRGFSNKKLYRLEKVPLDKVADIKTYLNVNLPYAEPQYIHHVVTYAAGLFIYASTVVKYVGKYGPREQNMILKKLFSEASEIEQNATALLDDLYTHILVEAFGEFDIIIWTHHMQILFTVLCTSECLSTTIAEQCLTAYNVISSLNLASEVRGGAGVDTRITNCVLKSLEAMLYVQNNKVLWHHKSFPDYIFDYDRSQDFWCDQHKHHGFLLVACFDIMKTGLQFNIAGIKSSFIFDNDNSILPDSITKSIPPTLSYACRTWDTHLPFVASSEAMTFFCKAMGEFLHLQVLFWIEAMNLLKLSSSCSQMLKKASQHIEKVNPDLANQLIEAAKFANYFSSSPAALSTPHLYISALSTWPGTLKPCKTWKDSFPKIPAIKSRAYSSVSPVLTIEVGSKVNSVAFSPNNTHIVSGSCVIPSMARPLKVWDASTGKQICVMRGHTSEVSSVAYSPDSRYIISGSHDNRVGLWDAVTGVKINMLTGHTSWITSVAFSPDGRYIVSTSFLDELQQFVRIWDPSTGEQIYVLKGHAHEITSVAFAPDSKYIVSGSADESAEMPVQIWDISTGEQFKELCGPHANCITCVAFSPDGKYIISGSEDKSVQVWDLINDIQMFVLQGHTEEVTSVAFSPDNNYIVSGSKDKSVRIWDASSKKQIHQFQGHTDSVNSVAFSPDGLHIASGSDDNTIKVWITTMQPKYVWEQKERIHTGWLILSDTQDYLLFMPVDTDAFNNLTMAESSSFIDFSHSTVGPQWFKCYKS